MVNDVSESFLDYAIPISVGKEVGMRSNYSDLRFINQTCTSGIQLIEKEISWPGMSKMLTPNQKRAINPTAYPGRIYVPLYIVNN